MRPTPFDGANVILKPPPGVEDVLALPVRRSEVDDGSVTTVSCWELEPGDLEEIQRTGRVWLSVQGRTHAPLYLAAVQPFEQPEG